jgi:hypothetical protein
VRMRHSSPWGGWSALLTDASKAGTLLKEGAPSASWGKDSRFVTRVHSSVDVQLSLVAEPFAAVTEDRIDLHVSGQPIRICTLSSQNLPGLAAGDGQAALRNANPASGHAHCPALVCTQKKEGGGGGVEFSPAKFARKLQIFTRVQADLVRVERSEIAKGLRAVGALVRSVIVVNPLVRRHQAFLLERLCASCMSAWAWAEEEKKVSNSEYGVLGKEN